ncbi:glycoside hydrolase family 18 protein [Granulicella sp. S190]|uniref:glycoside hydrolase family 18 protein n=1 Tax=Granulicella sp. S190 TaxID=1747226 RepID=UPI00131C9001|nr:glycoside hydrolase family 18 protein [Granulicella sp. S190]
MKQHRNLSKPGLVRIGHSLSCVFILILCFPMSLRAAEPSAAKKQIIAYIFPKDRILAPGEVSAGKLTRINYAFADLQKGQIIEGFPHDAENFAVLNTLKRDNPSLTLLVSIGGWTWSGNFSEMALTKQGRKVFIESTVKFIEKYQLDGLDIDWEYPGMPGDNHPFRPEDKHNYTLLLKELRARFDHEEKRLHRHLVTSIATGASNDFLDHTEMAKVQRYVDTVNLMSYDYYVPSWDKTTGHHAPLFTNPVDPKKISADRTVHEYESAGVPAEKLVLGLPFYGKSWGHVPDQNHGLFQPGREVPGSYLPYSSLINLENNGFIRYWDTQSSAPYLYNQATQTFISYDDPESLTKKCEYVLDHKLAGVMFWEYTGDSGSMLLDSINSGLGDTRAVKTVSR